MVQSPGLKSVLGEVMKIRKEDHLFRGENQLTRLHAVLFWVIMHGRIRDIIEENFVGKL